jgi:2-oxoglutarate ferredoxin oxidoreductase subunit delta
MKIIIDPERCKGDGLCVDLCPVHVFQFRIVSTEPERKQTIVANADSCICCKICEVNCPSQAIRVLMEEL